jgi:hypothetical protein
MIVLQHHAAIQTILDDWHASLVRDTAGGMTMVRDEDLRQLVHQLMQTFDALLSPEGDAEIATGGPARLPS